jgi:hypothetical protein
VGPPPARHVFDPASRTLPAHSPVRPELTIDPRFRRATPWAMLRHVEDVEVPVSELRATVVDGLLIETQVVPMDRATAERLADRIMEGADRRGLTVVDRTRVAAWLGAVDAEVRPLLRLRGRGIGVCDVRGHHVMVTVRPDDWPYDVVVCEDCEAATQVEADTY